MQNSIHSIASTKVVLTAEHRDRVFALRKVDEALTEISAAYTRHEGIYGAFLNSLLCLDELDHLPQPTQKVVAEFLNVLTPEPGLDRFDQARATVASLTECETLQFIDNLLGLRFYLSNTKH